MKWYKVALGIGFMGLVGTTAAFIGYEHSPMVRKPVDIIEEVVGENYSSSVLIDTYTFSVKTEKETKNFKCCSDSGGGDPATLDALLNPGDQVKITIDSSRPKRKNILQTQIIEINGQKPSFSK